MADEKPTCVVSKGQLAQLLGVHASYIWRYVDEGMPILRRGGRGRGDANYFDAVACLAWWRANRLTLPSDLESAEIRRMQLDFDLARLKLLRRKGEFVSRAQVAHDWRALREAVAAAALALPGQALARGAVAPGQLAGFTDLCRQIAERIAATPVPCERREDQADGATES